jgi:hypothetical protein
MTTIPPFETQLGWLTHEMGTGDGGNIQGTFYNNPGMSASEAAAAFEKKYERSDTISAEGQRAYQNRLANANNVYSAIQNGTLTSYHPRVQQAYAHLKNQGYTDAQAAGIIGNLQVESGQTLDPNSINPGDGSDGSDSIGIAQWNSGRAANLQAYDPATGEVVPNTFVQEGDIDAATGQPLTAEEAKAVRDEARSENNRRRQGSLYQENILNQFDNYTYSWAVHIHHPNLVGTYDDFSQIISAEKVITLAESGVENEISIDSVNQSLVLTYAKENRNSVANLFTIEFIEAMGATFYTRIYDAALRLGIENHLEACYILELNFRGWRADGSSVPVIIGPYFYQTKLTKLSMNFKDGASFYTGSFIETTEDAYARLNFHLVQAITISASNFGDFLTKFEKDINQQARAQVIATTGRLFPNVYHFTTTDEYADWKSFVFDDLADIEQTRGISVNISGGTLNITLPQGTSITSAISMVLFQTKQFKRIITNYGYAKDAPADTVAKPEKLAEIVKWVSYETEVGYLTYDMLHRHYPKDITFRVKGFLTPEAIHDPSSYDTGINSVDMQTDRLREILNTGLLRKRFDYTYTGKNTEVLELDVTLNNVFYTLQALSHGAVSMPAAFFNGIGGEQQREVAALMATEQDLKTEMKAAQNRVDSLRSENTSLVSSPANASAANQDLINRNRAEIDSINNEIKKLEKRTNAASDRSAQALIDLWNNTKTNVTALPSPTDRYLTQDELLNPTDFTRYLPNNFDFSEVQSLATVGPESPDNPGAAMLGAMEVNLNASGDLIQQSIVIRGDPYWLGRPKGYNNTETQADYNIGGVMYFLNIEFPTYPSETTGLSNNTRNFMLAGLYRVIKVNANYSNGQFTMTLNSFRDTNTNSETMYDDLIAGNVADSRIRNNPGNTTRDRQNDTDNNPNVADPNNAGSDNAADGAVGNNTTSTNGLAANLNPDLIASLEEAAAASGVAVRTISGVRPPDPNASGRHQHGDASDTQLVVNGRVLSAANPSDLAIIKTFTQNYVAAARSRGYIPSVGWADTSAPQSQWYMRGVTGHYDIAMDNPNSPKVTSDRATTYWGNGEKPAGAPAWLKNIMTG